MATTTRHGRTTSPCWRDCTTGGRADSLSKNTRRPRSASIRTDGHAADTDARRPARLDGRHASCSRGFLYLFMYICYFFTLIISLYRATL